MRRKKSDCVEMQHKAGERIYQITKDMTFEQELAYWQERDRLFAERMRKLRAVRKSG